MKKILLFLSMFLLLGIVSVNAKTIYTENKKFELYKMEEKGNEYALLGYKDKTYVLKNEEESMSFYEMDFKDKLTIKSAELDIEKVIEEFATNAKKEKYVTYEYDWDNKVLYKNTMEKNYGNGDYEEVDLSVIPGSDYYYRDFINGKLVFFVIDEEKDYIYFLNEDGSLNKKVSVDDLYSKISDYFDDYYGRELDILYNSSDKDPYLKLTVYSEGETPKYIYYIFDFNGNLLDKFDYTEYFRANLEIYNNGKEDVYLFSTCKMSEDDELPVCEVNVINKNGDKTSILKASNDIMAWQKDGFIYVGEYTDEKSIISIYDNDFNLIVKEEASDAYMSRLIDGMAAIENESKTYNQIANNEYMIYFYRYVYDEELGYSIEQPIANYYLKVEDTVKTTITGIVKDNNGNPLKNYTVELHSTPRTVKTDENGYFIFENVEEGSHTLTIIDPDGKKIATKSINVISSNETKLDGDTLYFDSNSKGFDIELKIDGEELSIEKVSNEPKDAPKLKLLSNEIVPKTADAIMIYITSLIIVISVGLLIKIKIKKMN